MLAHLKKDTKWKKVGECVNAEKHKAGEIMNITQQVALEASSEQKPLTKEVALKAFRRLNEL